MSSNRWFMLAVLFLARAAMGFQFQTVGSIAPMLVESLGVDYARLGTLIGLYLLPGIFIALPGGMLGDRFGAKPVAVVGLGLMAAGGLLMAVSPSFLLLTVGRLVGGTGAVLMNVVLTKMVSDWFADREIRTAMAILVASWPLGIALGLVICAPLAQALGWQAVMLAGVVMCLLKLALVAICYRDPPGTPAHASGALALDLSAREWRLVLLAGFVWGVYNVGYIVLISFLPGLLTAQGYTLNVANSTVSLLGWALIGMVPAGGYLADRSGRSDLVMMAGFILTALATVLLTVPSLTLAAFIVILIAGGLPAGAIMALPAGALRPQNRAAGMGIYFTCYYALMSALPALAGLSRDMTGSEASPLLFAAAMLVLGVVGVAAFRLAARRPVASAA
jgi:predicted MFS family arabinose efflux permease